MVCRSGTVVAVLALLFGFVAAPHTHVHQPADVPTESHHTHETTLVHAHVAPHTPADHRSEPPAGREHEDAGSTWSVGGFVFQPVATADAPSPALLADVICHVDGTNCTLSVQRPRPNAHGPPPETGSDLRAPPVFPPAFI